VLDLVRLNQQVGRRKIDHLSAFHPLCFHWPQIRLTVLAAVHLMHDHRVRCRRELQGLAVVARLSSGFLLAFLAQTLWLAHKPIRGGRLMAVVARLAQAFFQGLHPLEQVRNQFVLLGKLAVSQRLIFCSKLDWVFFWLHASYFTHSFALLQARRRPE
jgi:hypothetical protein